MKKYPFKAIAAVALNNVIGRGMEIPWKISEDFRFFKETTMGGVIVFGRKTWQSIGSKPLPGRENVVISRTLKSADGAKVFSSLEELKSAYDGDPRQIWICGGEQIYSAALPDCDEIFLSIVKRTVEGDVYFPDISKDFVFVKKLKETDLFDTDLYVRKPE